MPYVAVPDHLAGDVFTLANWQTHIEGNLNAGVNRPLADIILGASAATIDFTSIPQTFANLLCIVTARCDTASAFGGLFYRLNGDSAGDYDYEALQGNAAAVTTGETFASTAGSMGGIPGSTAGASLLGCHALLIGNYTSAFTKTAWSIGARKSGVATGNLLVEVNASFWRLTSAVNRVTFSTSGNFVAGTRVTLYGMGYA